MPPNWLKRLGYNRTMNKLFELYNDYYYLRYSSKSVLRIRVGPLMKRIINNMRNAIEKYPDNIVNVYEYSTHPGNFVYLNIWFVYITLIRRIIRLKLMWITISIESK